MRLLWSIHLYPPAHNCGSEYVAHMVNKFLITKGHHVRVILHQYNGDPYIYEGVEVFPASGKVDAYAWADVIMTHLDMTQFTIIMANSAHRPLVHFVHNDIPYSSIMQSWGRVYAVYNSQWIADSIGYKITGFVLKPPCSFDDYKTETTRDYITLISLNESKGGDFFCDIIKAMPDKKFLGVIGSYDRPMEKKLTQIEIINNLCQLPNFTLVPNTPDIISTYAKTRILLMPSDYESWGRTATEAMCSGIPVICTPTPGLVENCGEAAVYVGEVVPNPEPGEIQCTRGDVQEWVKAIRNFDNPEVYEKYSLLCSTRAAELDPAKDLENLEAFLFRAYYEK